MKAGIKHVSSLKGEESKEKQTSKTLGKLSK
jgi:hypothetical protein